MSSFKIAVHIIESVRNHPNADRLDLATLHGMGWTFVVGRDQYKPGDAVVYFPIDSVLPESIQETLGLKGKLSKNRVKTIRLRGEYSQGLVASPADLGITEYLPEEDLAERLGVTKYEPPTLLTKQGRISPLPATVSHYDIENVQNFPVQFEDLLDQFVYITEKVEGSHFAISLDADGVYTVCSRNCTIERDGDKPNTWLDVAETWGGKERLDRVRTYLKEQGYVHAAGTLTLRGELIGPGIQGNIYGLNSPKVLFFDLEINQQPVPPSLFIEAMSALGIETVPLLEYDVHLETWLAGKSLLDASTGQSVLAQTLREGIVVKPMVEQRDSAMGRLFFKARSLAYLDKEVA